MTKLDEKGHMIIGFATILLVVVVVVALLLMFEGTQSIATDFLDKVRQVTEAFSPLK